MATPAAEAFVIPSADELEEISADFAKATTRVEELYLKLLHATGCVAVETPLNEFAERPTYEDIGALMVLAENVSADAQRADKHAAEIKAMLAAVDTARLDWPTS